MALADSAFSSSLTTAFASPTWVDFSLLFGTALNNYILSGTVNTNVVAVVPAPGHGTGLGVGPIITTGVAAMQSTITALAINPATTWANFGKGIADAMNLNIGTATVATIVTPAPPVNILGGVGVGAVGCINGASVLVAYEAAVSAAFLLTSHALTIAAIVTATKTFLMGAVVTTADSGAVPVPPAPGWSGIGTGAIT